MRKTVIFFTIMAVFTMVLTFGCGDGKANSEWQKILNAKSSMTKAQWDEFKKQYKGKQIKWVGFIGDVGKCQKDKCLINIMMTETEPRKLMGMAFSHANHYIEKEKALKLKLGQKVILTGIIDNIKDYDKNFVEGGVGVEFRDLNIE